MTLGFLVTLALALQPPTGQGTAAQARTSASQTPSNPEGVVDRPDSPSGQRSPSPPSTNATVNPSSYRVGLQDEIKITVFDEPDLSATYRIDGDGTISFPLIGRVAAAGSTLLELQQRITAMLAAGFIRNPQVRIEINQYKSQFVYVIGEVRAPGKITMTNTKMTLLEALALAGSPTANASNEVIVVHPSRPGTGQAGSDTEGTRVTVNRRDLELGKAGQDIMLQDGDIINVPSAQHFYITGMVRNPGTFVLDPGITVQQAIALAGGLNERGSDRRIKASRLVKGKLVETEVELEDKVQPNDTVIIGSRFF